MDLEERTLQEKLIYKGKVVSLKLLDVQLPNGQTGKREVVLHQGAVAVLPVLENGNFLMVRQFRKALDKAIWEIPAGKLEEGESPEKCALRELLEETGHTARSLRRMSSFYTSPGFSNERIHLFLAEGLELQGQQLDEDEFLHLREVPGDEVYHWYLNGELEDAKTVAAVLAWKVAQDA